MEKYIGSPDYRHESQAHTGLLLVNLGTPEAPTPRAVRRYLKEFLSDPRVIEFPRWLWLPILYAVILTVRPARAAKAYSKVWTEDGSPLLTISQRQSQGLQRALHGTGGGARVKVALGMCYGEPSVRTALRQLHAEQVRRLLVLPLYPQYSGSTTGAVFDAVSAELKTWRWVPALRFVNGYHDEPGYITALADAVRSHWRDHQPAERLLFSFHGLPQRYLLAGDPYHCQCHKSARRVAQELGLADQSWSVAFQSRFGREQWLQPYTDATLKHLPNEGVRSVDVICPGFAADCLETLEEIDQENRRLFLDAGGQVFHYIPCLNDDPSHITMLAGLTQAHLQGWDDAATVDESGTLQRALACGAQQ